MADALMAEQRADGGWSQIATRQSDAYATGTGSGGAQSGRPGTARQREPSARPRVPRHRPSNADGSWHVPTRRTWREGLPYFESGYPHGPDQFISYSGAALATSALALGLQDAVSPGLMGTPPATARASSDDE